MPCRTNSSFSAIFVFGSAAKTPLKRIALAVVACAFAAAGHAEPTKSQISFGSAVKDAEAEAILSAQPIETQAVFTWSFGMSGSHRSYVPASAKEVVQAARAQMINSFTRGFERANLQLRKFADEHTVEAIESDQALQSKARSLLNTRSQMEKALLSARRGEPLIYAVEVRGEPAQLEALRKSPQVSAVEYAADGKVMRQSKLKPDAYKAEYRDPEVFTVSPRDLHKRLIETASSEMAQ